jgi:hypothetical protein
MGAGPVALERKDESRRERLALLRSQANRLFKKHGALNTLAFCMRLVSAAGSVAMDRRRRGLGSSILSVRSCAAWRQ